MKLKLLIGILLFLIALNLATIGSFLYSQWKQPNRIAAPLPGPDREDRGARIRRLPPIEQEKRDELRRLLHQLHRETAELRGQIDDLEAEALILLERDPVPRDSLDLIVEQISGLRVEINRRAMDKLIEAKNHLDPHQQRMFFRMILGSRPDRHVDVDHGPGEGPHDRRGGRHRGNRI